MYIGNKLAGVLTLLAITCSAVVFFCEEQDYAAQNYSIEEINTVENPVKLNTATSQELETLPEIGPKTAENIIEFRTTVRRFESVHDVKLVKGIGDKTFDIIKASVVTE